MRGVCRCGHPAAAHLHYRRGSDCALCEPGQCLKYRRARWWRRAARLPRVTQSG